MIFSSGQLKRVFVASSRALRLREVHLKKLCNFIRRKNNGLYGEAPPERDTFSGFRYEWVEILLVEVYEMVGILVILVCKLT